MTHLEHTRFVEIPGAGLVELPPLLIHDGGHPKRLDRVMDLAHKVIEKEDMVPNHELDALAGDHEVERRKMDLALNLVGNYQGMLRHWHWGDGVLEWIRQCETTFESRMELRALLRPDVWPHASRSSFVTLLSDRAARDSTLARGWLDSSLDLEKAVGLRLAFRQPPPLACCSDQFLFYLNGTLADTAYKTWSAMSPAPHSAFPPDRFAFQVVKM